MFFFTCKDEILVFRYQAALKIKEINKKVSSPAKTPRETHMFFKGRFDPLDVNVNTFLKDPGARTLLGTSASLLVTSALLVVTRTLLGAPGLTTRSKDATRTHFLHFSQKERQPVPRRRASTVSSCFVDMTCKPSVF